jgi:hypothetical protein
VEPVEEENALFGPEATEKAEVGLPVLYTELPCRMGFIKGRHPVSDTVFSEQGGGDGLDILLLKDTEILTQAAAPERGRKRQMIVHLPVVVFPCFHSGDDAVEVALWNGALPEGECGVLFEEIRSGEAGLVPGDIDTE